MKKKKKEALKIFAKIFTHAFLKINDGNFFNFEILTTIGAL